MSHENNIVKKPWGYEYLMYENEHVALWFLYIKKGERTSTHCHPNKTTGLTLLDGKAEVSFLSDVNKLSSLNKIMIRKGLFHSTQAVSDIQNKMIASGLKNHCQILVMYTMQETQP